MWCVRSLITIGIKAHVAASFYKGVWWNLLVEATKTLLPTSLKDMYTQRMQILSTASITGSDVSEGEKKVPIIFLVYVVCKSLNSQCAQAVA